MLNTTKFINVDESLQPKWVCAADALAQNKKYAQRYTYQQQRELDDLYARVSSTYNARSYRNYRAKFRAVKVEHPTYSDLVSLAVREFNAWAAQQKNIEVVTTRGAIIYRLTAA